MHMPFLLTIQKLNTPMLLRALGWVSAKNQQNHVHMTFEYSCS